uniref:NACHT domain-containing protein n=1 Tax=Sinocyclocheilus rhinocerous TaxID=307959 RepID=A0A673HNS1_9TELE
MFDDLNLLSVTNKQQKNKKGQKPLHGTVYTHTSFEYQMSKGQNEISTEVQIGRRFAGLDCLLHVMLRALLRDNNNVLEALVECTNLFQPGKDKKIKTVLTKGVAGIGKSVSVQKFVVDWAEEKENQDISFVFPLPFREMNLKEEENQSLMSLVSQFFPETKGLNLTRRNQFKVLFILDGLDECRLPLNFEGNETWRDVSSPASLDVLLTNLIKGNLLPSALIWITTRPAAASKIPPDFISTPICSSTS